MPSSIHPTASSPIRERNPSADRSEQSGDPRAFHHGFGAKFTHTTSRRPVFKSLGADVARRHREISRLRNDSRHRAGIRQVRAFGEKVFDTIEAEPERLRE